MRRDAEELQVAGRLQPRGQHVGPLPDGCRLHLPQYGGQALDGPALPAKDRRLGRVEAVGYAAAGQIVQEAHAQQGRVAVVRRGQCLQPAQQHIVDSPARVRGARGQLHLHQPQIGQGRARAGIGAPDLERLMHLLAKPAGGEAG